MEIKDKDIEPMTAGQRNCYIAIAECLDRYSLDDVLTALREHLAETRDCDKRKAALVIDSVRRSLAMTHSTTTDDDE